jgi:sugar lactone lactonase YvrE
MPAPETCITSGLMRNWMLAWRMLPLLFLPNCVAQSNPPYIIATVAGSGPSNVSNGGYDGDSGAATRALLNSPASVALDRAGNLYVCDFNVRIRKVAARTGIITTVAGTGTRGYSGDGGPATSAQLGGPGDIAVDAAGNIYFGDGSNHRVRRISADTGIITTVAGNGSADKGSYRTIAGKVFVENGGDGGLAINVGIGIPSGLAIDALGSLYFTNGGDRVRKVAARTGIITTVAGAGGSLYSGDGGPAVLAQLDQPSKVAFDVEGNMYVAARGEHRIRRVSAKTGIITTVAGASPGTESPFLGSISYRAGFSGDGGPATEALLNDPVSVALDKAGNLYISDTLNFRIRRVDARTGIIETIAGTGVRGYGGDGGPASGALITTPSGIAVDNTGQVYFGDQGNHRIRVLRRKRRRAFSFVKPSTGPEKHTTPLTDFGDHEAITDLASFILRTGASAIATFDDVPTGTTNPVSSGLKFSASTVVNNAVGMPHSFWFPAAGSSPNWLATVANTPNALTVTFPSDVTAFGFLFTCFACDTLANDAQMHWTLLSDSGASLGSGSSLYNFGPGFGYAAAYFLGVQSKGPFRSAQIARQNASTGLASVGVWFADDFRFAQVPHPAPRK